MSDFKHGHASRDNKFEPDAELLTKIILNGDVEALNKYADDLGKRFKKPIYAGDKKIGKELSSSQIRKVLDEIQRMVNPSLNDLKLIQPKLAYAAGRHGGRVKELYQIVEKAINLITESSKEQFKNFKNFFEAIVAYHRYYGGE